jgi:hypothetical protein
MSIILLVISEKKIIADDEKFLETPMNKILYIHGFDQVPGFKTFPLIPLDVEHLLPIRIYKTNSATKSLFHRLRISYKVNGPLVEQADLFVKMKIKILKKDSKKSFKNNIFRMSVLARLISDVPQRKCQYFNIGEFYLKKLLPND